MAQPCLVIVGGVNGTGKSTFARAAAGTSVLLDQTAINPDELTLAATEEARKKKFDLGLSGANLIGVERAEKAVWAAIARGKSVAVETVLSSEKFVDVVDAARTRQFKTRLVYIALPDVEMAIARVAARVELGGHGVPEERIRKRWAASHRNMALFGDRVDDLLVFSNAGATPVLVASREGRTSVITMASRSDLPDVTKALGA